MDKSKNIYSKPFPKDAKLEGSSYDSPAHAGPFKGAIDFLVPLGTQVLAPLNGVVHEVEDSNELFGDDPKFEPNTNYITIQHKKGEFSQILHLAKGSIKVKVGDKVREGQQVAVSGNSGWMTGPHLHFFVFKNFPDGSFKGLKIRFKE